MSNWFLIRKNPMDKGHQVGKFKDDTIKLVHMCTGEQMTVV